LIRVPAGPVLWTRLAVLACVLAPSGISAQAPIINARVETRTLARTLGEEVQAIADRGAPAWIGYRVPMLMRSGGRLQFTGTRARCRLEPPADLVVLARVEAKTVVELRALGADCDVDADRMPLIWFDNVNPEQSVAWLASLIADVTAGRRGNRLIDPALSALAMHASPAAARTLVSLARDGQPSSLRGQALIWLGQHAGAQAGPAIADAIERDPEVEVKRRAVMALGQLPRDEGVPLLITVARTHKSTEVRRQAMVTLGQSNDPRALAFFESVLLR
jgi:hypothetical protein